jgi:hypothetical protein
MSIDHGRLGGVYVLSGDTYRPGIAGITVQKARDRW